MRRIYIPFCTLFLFFILLLQGCGTEKLEVDIKTPKTFQPGEAMNIQLKVSKQDGSPVVGANVHAVMSMKGMDHGKVNMDTQDIGEGKYMGQAKLSMDGQWIAEIQIDQNGNQYTETKEFSFEAKSSETAHKVTKNIELPDFNLINQDGKPISRKDLVGKKVVMTFTYVKCNDPNACSVLLGNLRKLQLDLSEKGIKTDDIELVSVSVDPVNDTPEVMKNHAKEMNFDMSYINLLTGQLKDVKQLTDTLGVRFEKTNDVVLHDNKTMIFDKTGKLTHEFQTSQIDRQELFDLVSGK
ncbi:MAG TPA: FixH family protein [Bacillota bacterium]|nr:FixH family protein [Bacillota bacterium]